MHTLPLFCPTHACPPPILSHPMHAYAYPAPYSIPARAYLPPILSQPMHTFPLFYPTPCIPSPYSIPAHAHPPPILSQPIHTLPLFYSSPYMPPPYSISLYECPLLFSTSPHMPPQYSIPAHVCTPNSLSHEPGRHVYPLTSENAAFESAHTEYIIIISNLKHQFMTPEFLLFSFTWIHHMELIYTLDPLSLHIYHIITTYIVYHYSSVDITQSSTWLHIHNNKLHTPIIVFFVNCSHCSTGKVDVCKCDLSRNCIIYGKS